MSTETAAHVRDSVAASFYTTSRQSVRPSSATPRPTPSGRTFRHGSRYDWGTNWEELFSSSEGQKEDWDSSGKEGSESEEIDYYDLSPRRPPLVNGHGGRGSESRQESDVRVHGERGTRAREEVESTVSGNGNVEWGEEQQEEEREEEEDADCEDEDGDDDAQSQDGADYERGREDRRSSPEDPQPTPRPRPRGEWYDGTRDGTIWNAGLNGTG